MQASAYDCSGVLVFEQHIDNANPSVTQSVWCLGAAASNILFANRMDMENIILNWVIFTLIFSSCSMACLYKTSLTIVY